MDHPIRQKKIGGTIGGSILEIPPKHKAVPGTGIRDSDAQHPRENFGSFIRY
jgi:hypothetical protein